MNLSFVVSKETCFYYWIQVVSCWDEHTTEPKAYDYYQTSLQELSERQVASLSAIKRLLLRSTNPRAVLRDLYSGQLLLVESTALAKEAEGLRDKFEPVWRESSLHLESWKKRLRALDLNSRGFSKSVERIVHLLASDFTPTDVYTVYLLQNPRFAGPAGHAISNSDHVLLHPPGSESQAGTIGAVATLAHEYVHLVEFRSAKTVRLCEESYKRLIEPIAGSEPKGMTWRMMYRETLVNCFASLTIRGLLSPLIYARPQPTVQEMRPGFLRSLKQGRMDSEGVANWAALSVLPDVVGYITAGKAIDRALIDKISSVFVQHADVV